MTFRDIFKFPQIPRCENAILGHIDAGKNKGFIESYILCMILTFCGGMPVFIKI